jgi:hypothetical protein
MSVLETLPPEKLLSGSFQQIQAGVACIEDLETLRKYIGHENQNQNRIPVLNLLRIRAKEIREDST